MEAVGECLRDNGAHERLLRLLLVLTCSAEDGCVLTSGGGEGRTLGGGSWAAQKLSRLCGDIVSPTRAHHRGGADVLPDGLEEPSSYEVAVDSVEAFLAPLLLSLESQLQSRPSNCLHYHLARSVLWHLSMDPESCLRPLTDVDRALADGANNGAILGMGGLKSFFLSAVHSGGNHQISGATTPVIIPLPRGGRSIVLVESADALVLALGKYLPAPATDTVNNKPGSSGGTVVSLQGIFHRHYSSTGLMTYLCLSTSTHDVLIDMISPAQSAIFHLAPLLTCTGVTKMVYGLETPRHLHQHFQLNIVNGIDILLLAKLMDLPLLSLSSLQRFFSDFATSAPGITGGIRGMNVSKTSSISSKGSIDVTKSPIVDKSGYILHDSLRRPSLVVAAAATTTSNSSSSNSNSLTPVLPDHLLMLCRTTHALLDIELALERELELGCQALQGVTPQKSYLYKAAPTSPPVHFNPMGYKALLTNQRTPFFGCPPPLTSRQDRVLGALWQWRESTSVELAISSPAVASNASLLFLSITSPKTMRDWQQYARFFPLGYCVRILAEEVLRCISLAADLGPVVPMYLSVSQSYFDDAEGNDIEVEACSFSKIQSHISGSRSLSPRGFSSPVPYTRIASEPGKAGAKGIAGIAGLSTGSPGRRGGGSSAGSTCLSHQLPAPSKVAAERETTTASFVISSPPPTPVLRASPELAEDVFRYAGWSTPNTFDRASSPYPHPHNRIEGDDERDDNPGGLVHLPDTCEEIYEISNRNRRLRKHCQDGEDGHSVADSNTTVTGKHKSALTSSWDSKGNSVYSSIDSIGSLASGGSACASESAILQPIPLAAGSRHPAAPGAWLHTFSHSIFDETIYFTSDPLPMTANEPGAASSTSAAKSTDSGASKGENGAIAGLLSGAAVDALLDFSTVLGWVASARLREEIRAAHHEALEDERE